MTTLSEFRSELRSIGNFPANDTKITDAVIDREINRALRRIAMLHDWPWLDAERTFVTASEVQAYSLPNDFLRAVSFRYPEGRKSLTLLNIQEFDDLYGTGDPWVYAIRGTKLYVGPVPTGEKTLKLRYIRQERVLTGDSDTPLIPDYWDDGVLEAALVQLHRQVKQLDLAGLAEAKFQEWVIETRDNITQTRSQPRIRVRPGSQL